MSKIYISVLIIIAVVILLFAGYGLMNRPTLPVNQSTPQQTPAPTTKTYTLSDVKSHNSQASCWSAINNKVYDLTEWINEHPGGASRIIGICGLDGSSEFNSEHQGQKRPANELAEFYIGNLSN